MRKHASIIIFLIFISFRMAAAPQRLALPVEKNPFDEQELRPAVWDATSQSVIDERSRSHISLSSKGLIREYLDSFTSLYLFVEDSVYFRGSTYGTEIGVLADTAKLVLRFPLSVGSRFGSEYAARGLAFSETPIAEKGSVLSEVLSRGRFIHAPGDTSAATMTYEKRCMATVFAPTDSSDYKDVPSHTLEFYRWYGEGNRLPFAVQRRLDGGEWRLWLCGESAGQSGSDSDRDKDIRPSILANAEISVGNGFVSVTLGAAEDVVAEIHIVDVSGNIFGRTHCRLSDTDTTISISTDGLAHGSYMLVIILDNDPSLTEKRMLAL